MAEVKFTVEAVDKATKVLENVGKSVEGLDKTVNKSRQTLSGRAESNEKTFAKMQVAGTVALGAITLLVNNLITQAQQASVVRDTFETLTTSIDASTEVLQNLRKVTNGFVSDQALMQASNRFVAMGLAESEDEMLKLTKVAVRLGEAMGSGPTESIENFALLLANQSIPRLDSFGISSGRVRARIEELQEQFPSMTRETAFMTATMEAAEASMNVLGERTLQSGDRFRQLQVQIGNISGAVGEQLLVQFDRLIVQLDPIISKITQRAEANPDFTAKLIIAGGAIAGVVLVLGTLGAVLPSIIAGIGLLKTAFIAFKATLLLIMSPIGLMITAVVGLYLAYQTNFLGLRDLVDKTINNITVIFNMFIDFLAKWIVIGISKFHRFSQNLSNIWDGIKNMVQKARQFISQYFSSGINNIIALMDDWFYNIVTIFLDLVNRAKQAGLDLMNKFAEGIKSGVDKVVRAAKDVARKVKSYLGFSSPTEKGPFSKSDKRAPNFMNMFADGIEDNTPNVIDKVKELAKTSERELSDKKIATDKIKEILGDKTTKKTKTKTRKKSPKSELSTLTKEIANARKEITKIKTVFATVRKDIKKNRFMTVLDVRKGIQAMNVLFNDFIKTISAGFNVISGTTTSAGEGYITNFITGIKNGINNSKAELENIGNTLSGYLTQDASMGGVGAVATASTATGGQANVNIVLQYNSPIYGDQDDIVAGMMDSAITQFRRTTGYERF